MIIKRLYAAVNRWNHLTSVPVLLQPSTRGPGTMTSPAMMEGPAREFNGCADEEDQIKESQAIFKEIVKKPAVGICGIDC